MDEHPSLFLYAERGGVHELCAAPLSLVAALAHLDQAAALRVSDFGATGYRKLGWATVADLPPLPDVAAARDFVAADLGVLVFEAHIEGLGTLAWHDGGECHFRAPARGPLLGLLGRLAPPAFAPRLTAWLLAHPGRYVAVGSDGALTGYASFEAFRSS